MNWGLGLQQSKLARRLLTVFLLCVLAPVLGLTAVSYVQVRSQLVDQSLIRLERDAKAVVMSVLERLILADGVVQTLTVQDTEVQLAQQRADGVNPVAAAIWTRSDGTPLHTFGDWPSVPRPNADEVDRFRRGTVLRTHPEGGKVVLARTSEQGAVWVAVDTTFLWNSASEFAQLRGESASCILDPDSRPIRCDARMPVSALAPHLRTRTPFTLEIGGVPYRAVTREIYFDWYFGAEPWSVVLAEPYSEATGPLVSFRRVFIPVVLTSVLVMLFFSSVHLRRIFARLLLLKSATSRISDGEFEVAISMDGDDEITDLAGSIDEMSLQIGRQFALMRSVGAVDRAALETSTIPELCDRVVEALSESFPDCTRLVFLGLLSQTEGRMDGSVAYQVPSAPIMQSEVALTSDQTTRIARLGWAGQHRMADVVGMLGLPQLASLGDESPSLFPVRLDGLTHGFVAVTGRASNPENRQPVRQLADQVSVALSNVKRLDELQRLNWGALTALARTVDAASAWTAGHSERVANLSEQLGRKLGLDHIELERLRRGGLLHDIGKLGIPTAILEKNGKLTDDEFLRVQEHTVIGAKILEPIESFADILPLVLYHHERIDGEGYPMRVSGSAIPYGARIMAVADTFDALTSDRPYRKGMGLERALEIIQEVSGTQLDATMVDAFIEMMSEVGHPEPQSADGFELPTIPRKAELV